ncbi:MAG: alkaline phosphatase [Fibrobacterota bacterium]
MLHSILVLTLCVGCTSPQKKSSETSSPAPGKIKYLFLFIGDGMGLPQMAMTQRALERSIEPGKAHLAFTQFPVTGNAATHAQDRFITGSAAAGTALACGSKTTIGTVGMTADGDTLRSIAEYAKAAGKKVGIVSSVSIDHATPACFYAHEPARGNYNNIAAQMATSGFDYFGGGYAKGDFEKYHQKDPEGDPRNIPALMTEAGYTILKDRSALTAAHPGGRYWAVTEYDESAALNYEIDRTEKEISLAEFTREGIRLLDNDEGFFMMVEGGKIDWACHANDGASAVHDVIAFDKAVEAALNFYQKHPGETAVIVTGDHECGGLSLGFAGTEYDTHYDLLKHQKISFAAFTEKLTTMKNRSEAGNFAEYADSIAAAFGLGGPAAPLREYESKRLQKAFAHSVQNDSVDLSPYEARITYNKYDPLTVTATHLLNNRAGLGWTSYKHTAVPVPVYAVGPGTDIFTGNYDNTDIFHKMRSLTTY